MPEYSSKSERTYLFGPFRLSASKRTLFEGDRVVRLGSKAIEAILHHRDEDGAFAGLDDLVVRVQSAPVNRKALDSLVKCGAFDFSGIERSSMAASLESVLRWAGVAASHANQHNLFSGTGGGEPEKFRFERDSEEEDIAVQTARGEDIVTPEGE